jgi:hypothetical protein
VEAEVVVAASGALAITALAWLFVGRRWSTEASLVGGAMAASSLSVVTNANRLRSWRPQPVVDR